MSSSTDTIEVTAPSVDEAVSQALATLGAQADDVAIEVLTTPRAGVLGLGARQARVRVTRRPPEAASSGVMSPPPAPPPKPRPVTPSPRPAAPPRSRPLPPDERPAMRAMPAEEEALVEALSDDSETSSAGVTSPPPLAPRERRETPRPRRAAPPRSSAPLPAEERPLAREMPAEEEALVETLSEEADDTRLVADLKGQLAEASTVLARILELMGEQATIEVVNDDDPDAIELNIKGDGSGLLIGRHGQTLDALEYIVNRVLAHRLKDAAPISIDTESYRARRRGQLHRMALAKGEEAKREHQAVTLEPMPPRDRRIIHLALKDDPLITTRSSGEGFMRAVEIVPVDERREGPSDRGGRDRRRGRGGGPRGDSQPPVGQQGGFSHGQKRIV